MKSMKTSPSSIVTRKKTLIFETLQFSLVDDVIHIIYDYAKQPVIMMIGYELFKSHQQEVKAFDPSNNSWVDFITLPVTINPVSENPLQYHQMSITRMDNKSTQLLISCKHHTKQEFYKYDVIQNTCSLIYTPHFFQGEISRNHHVETLTILEGSELIFAQTKYTDHEVLQSVMMGPVANETSKRIILQRNELPYWIQVVLPQGQSVIYGRKLYLYCTLSDLMEFDLNDLKASERTISGFKSHGNSPGMTILNGILYMIGALVMEQNVQLLISRLINLYPILLN